MFSLPSPLNKIEHPFFDKHGVKFYIKRDDLIHSEVSGNKWRKLKYNFEYALKNGYSQVVTLGGAYSNHIIATAAAANHFGLQSVGIIRGDELNEDSNPTLQIAHKHGMKFAFVTRAKYREVRGNPEAVNQKYPCAYVIPEGGTNALAIKGTSEIIQEIDMEFHCIITAVGTGGTMAGLLNGLGGEKRVVGISSLKGGGILSDFHNLLRTYRIEYTNFELNNTYHFGGYGKAPPPLIDFINRMKQEIKVLFDPVYTGKGFFGIWDMISKGKFDSQTLVFLHTGGLQCITGFNQKRGQKIHI